MAEELRIDNNLRLEAQEKAISLATLRHSMVTVARDLIGTKSVKYTEPDMGLNPEFGFDCSGFISYVVKKVAYDHGMDISIPRHANEQWRSFGEPVTYSQRKIGDLVFFPSKMAAGIRIIGHVGLILDKNLYIHAPGKPDSVVCIDKLPYEPVPFDDHHPDDMHTHSPAGIKRITLPIGNGRWHVQ